VRGADDAPLAGAWVALREAGLWTATDGEGRFRFTRVRPGKQTVIVRTAAGEEATASAEVPGEPLDVVVGRARRPKG
jgi:hypothetical protein